MLLSALEGVKEFNWSIGLFIEMICHTKWKQKTNLLNVTLVFNVHSKYVVKYTVNKLQVG